MRSLLVLVLLATALSARANRGPFQKIAIIRLREEGTQAIDPSFKTSVLRRIEDARAWGADCFVFDIESYGGMVGASLETADEIYSLGREFHTIAYLDRKAISGAAMLSFSCQEIVMNEVALIGDSQVIYMNSSGEMVEAPEKFQTTVAAKFRTYAEGNGYPVAIAEAMVRKEIGVERQQRGDEMIYRRMPDGEPSPGWQTIVRPGELATFGANDAVEYGICSRLARNLDALVASISAPGAQVSTLDWTWAERASRWLLGIRVLLFLLGAGGLYFALKTPGTGVPELLAVICFGLFFSASAVSGFAGTLELVLFFAGILLIGVEIFLLPGLGFAGLAGLVLVLTSIGLAAIPAGDLPVAPTEYLLPMARDFLLGAIGAAILVFFLVRHLPKVPFLRGLVLETGLPAENPQAAPPHRLVGAKGVAETPLRPAGRATVDGVRMDVVTEGSYIDAETPVRVVEVSGNRVVVRAE